VRVCERKIFDAKTIKDDLLTIDDDTLILTSDVPMKFRLFFEALNYRPVTVNVEAV